MSMRVSGRLFHGSEHLTPFVPAEPGIQERQVDLLLFGEMHLQEGIESVKKPSHPAGYLRIDRRCLAILSEGTQLVGEARDLDVMRRIVAVASGAPITRSTTG
jgi:hypothetical protein